MRLLVLMALSTIRQYSTDISEKKTTKSFYGTKTTIPTRSTPLWLNIFSDRLMGLISFGKQELAGNHRFQNEYERESKKTNNPYL